MDRRLRLAGLWLLGGILLLGAWAGPLTGIADTTGTQFGSGYPFPTIPSSTTPFPSPVTVTVQTATYSSGNVMGGLLSFTAIRQNGYAQSFTLTTPTAQAPTLDLILFNANPTTSTITDKTAIAISAADQGKIIGVVHVSDCGGYSTPTVCQTQNLAMPYSLASGTTMYGALVTRSAITPGGTSWPVSLRTMVQ